MNSLEQSNFFLQPLLATYILSFSTAILILLYSIRKQTYWKKLGIPYVKPLPVIGSVYDNVKKPLQYVEMERYNKYGKIYGHYEGNTPLLSVAEPDLLRNIFVKDSHIFSGRRPFDTGDNITDNMESIIHGMEWKRLRTIISPAFTKGKVKRLFNTFKHCARTVVHNMKESSKYGDPVEVKSIYGAFSLDVIASSGFSAKIDYLKDPGNKFVKMAKSVFNANYNWRLFLLALFPDFMRLLGIAVFSPSGIQFFKAVTLQIIEERRRTGQRGNDFLQLVMDSAEKRPEEDELDESENCGTEKNGYQTRQNASTKQSMSQDELIAQCVMFFLTAYDTAASSLSFATYSLALNPDVQEKLIQEMDGVLEANNGVLTYEAVENMKYLENVIYETLRLYPPSIRLERSANEDYKLEGTGLTIPKGMLVSVPAYAIQRDPNYYPDPEKFDPNRFNSEEKAKRNPYVYLPFGAGPRYCLGMQFAMLELKVCLTYVLSNFRIKRCSKTKVPLQYYLGQGFLLAKDITVALEGREDSVKAL